MFHTLNTKRNNASIVYAYANERRNQHKKHIADGYLKAVKSDRKSTVHVTGLLHFPILSVVILLVVSMQSIAAEVSIALHLMSTPVSFGTTVYLACNIAQNSSCKTGFRQWFGGKKNRPLCQNTICVNSSKYGIMTNVINHRCSYTLMIQKFSEDDVNCEYTCSYGFRFKRKYLAVNDQDFQYIPTKNDISTDISKETFCIKLWKVYPAPNCSTILLENNTTIPMKMNLSNHGIFVEVVLTGNIVCEIGTTKRSIKTERFNFCSGNDDNQGTFRIAALITALTSTVAIILFIGCVWYKCPRKTLITLCKSYGFSCFEQQMNEAGTHALAEQHMHDIGTCESTEQHMDDRDPCESTEQHMDEKDTFVRRL